VREGGREGWLKIGTSGEGNEEKGGNEKRKKKEKPCVFRVAASNIETNIRNYSPPGVRDAGN